MGTDFIQKRAKGFRRRWDSERLDRITTNFLQLLPKDAGRCLAADITTSEAIAPGETGVFELADGALVFRSGPNEIARCHQPPASIVAAIASSAGVASGRIERVHSDAQVVELLVCD